MTALSIIIDIVLILISIALIVAVLMQEGRMTGSVHAVDADKPIRVRLADGELGARVTDIKPKEVQQ